MYSKGIQHFPTPSNTTSSSPVITFFRQQAAVAGNRRTRTSCRRFRHDPTTIASTNISNSKTNSTTNTTNYSSNSSKVLLQFTATEHSRREVAAATS